MRTTSSSELLLRQRLQAVTRSLPSARRGHGESLHQARVATRRLRETLPLVCSGRNRKLQRVVRRITRALGPVRELDVALELLDQMGERSDAPVHAMSYLRQVIREERRRVHADMLQKLDGCDIEKLRKRALAAARAEADRGGTLRRGAPERLAAARRQSARRAERLRFAMDSAAAIYLPDRLHEVRIALKKMRYALELSREIAKPRRPRPSSAAAPATSGAASELRTLKKAQDLLGHMHDLEVLIARTRGVQASPGVPDLKLSGEMDHLVRQLETECRRLHGHYMTLRPQLLTICDRAIARKPRERAHVA